MQRIPEHLVPYVRQLAVVNRGELRAALAQRKGIFGDEHPDTLEIRRQLEVAAEACAALGADRAAA